MADTMIARILDGLRVRLRELREAERAHKSLRAWARFLRERTGYDVSYQSVDGYEKDRAVPAEYLIAVVIATNASPMWLLFGQGPREWTHPATADRVEATMKLLDAAMQLLRGAAPADDDAAEGG